MYYIINAFKYALTYMYLNYKKHEAIFQPCIALKMNHMKTKSLLKPPIVIKQRRKSLSVFEFEKKETRWVGACNIYSLIVTTIFSDTLPIYKRTKIL